MAKATQDSTDSETGATFDVDSAAAAIHGLLGDDLDFKDQQVEHDESDESEDADDADADEDADDDSRDEADDDDSDESEDTEDDAEDDEDTDDAAPAVHKIKVDGEEIEVSLEEALAGYQRQQAFTKRTQALAEQRREVEAERATVTQKQQEYLDRLDVVTKALKGGDEPNWEKLKSGDRVAYAEQRAAWQDRADQLGAIETEQKRVRDELRANYKAERDRMISQEAERLESAIPEWAADPEVARSDKQRLAQFAQTTYGFTPQDLEQVVDHRVILLLRDAMQSHDMKAKGAKAKDALRGSRKRSMTLTPGKAGEKRQSKGKNPARTRLRQSGSVDDAAAVFFDMLE